MAAYATVKSGVLALDLKRKGIEHEIDDLLNQIGPIGMKEPLVDGEGFPRSDVDVYMVRTMRHKVICLQNDYTATMKELDAKLVELHSLEPPVRSEPALPSQPAAQGGPAVARPFAIVDELSPGSPAAEAGLRVGDRLVSFGPVCGPGSSLTDVAGVVRGNEGKPVPVQVLRAQEGQDEAVQLTLNLVPKRWSGQGLLGCHITVLQER